MLLVDGDARARAAAWEEGRCRGQHDQGDDAGDGGHPGDREEGVAEAVAQTSRRVAPAEPAAIVARTAMPIVPPISWPVVLSPDSMPLSSSLAPVMTDDGDADEHDAEAEAGDEHAGQDIAEVAAVGAGGRRAAASRLRSAANPAAIGTRTPACIEQVVADPDARGKRDGEGQEREAGLAAGRRPARSACTARSAGRSEQRCGRREHHEKAAPYAAVGQTLDPKQRLSRVQFSDDEAR